MDEFVANVFHITQSGDPEILTGAQKRLLEIQGSPSFWDLLDGLFAQPSPIVRFFAANALALKIQNDLHTPGHEHLVSSLQPRVLHWTSISASKANAKEPFEDKVLNRLLVTVVSLSCCEPWPSWLQDTLNALNAPGLSNMDAAVYSAAIILQQAALVNTYPKDNRVDYAESIITCIPSLAQVISSNRSLISPGATILCVSAMIPWIAPTASSSSEATADLIWEILLSYLEQTDNVDAVAASTSALNDVIEAGAPLANAISTSASESIGRTMLTQGRKDQLLKSWTQSSFVHMAYNALAQDDPTSTDELDPQVFQIVSLTGPLCELTGRYIVDFLRDPSQGDSPRYAVLWDWLLLLTACPGYSSDRYRLVESTMMAWTHFEESVNQIGDWDNETKVMFFENPWVMRIVAGFFRATIEKSTWPLAAFEWNEELADAFNVNRNNTMSELVSIQWDILEQRLLHELLGLVQLVPAEKELFQTEAALFFIAQVGIDSVPLKSTTVAVPVLSAMCNTDFAASLWHAFNSSSTEAVHVCVHRCIYSYLRNMSAYSETFQVAPEYLPSVITLLINLINDLTEKVHERIYSELLYPNFDFEEAPYDPVLDQATRTFLDLCHKNRASFVSHVGELLSTLTSASNRLSPHTHMLLISRLVQGLANTVKALIESHADTDVTAQTIMSLVQPLLNLLLQSVEELYQSTSHGFPLADDDPKMQNTICCTELVIACMKGLEIEHDPWDSVEKSEQETALDTAVALVSRHPSVTQGQLALISVLFEAARLWPDRLSLIEPVLRLMRVLLSNKLFQLDVDNVLSFVASVGMTTMTALPLWMSLANEALKLSKSAVYAQEILARSVAHLDMSNINAHPDIVESVLGFARTAVSDIALTRSMYDNLFTFADVCLDISEKFSYSSAIDLLVELVQRPFLRKDENAESILDVVIERIAPLTNHIVVNICTTMLQTQAASLARVLTALNLRFAQEFDMGLRLAFTDERLPGTLSPETRSSYRVKIVTCRSQMKMSRIIADMNLAARNLGNTNWKRPEW